MVKDSKTERRTDAIPETLPSSQPPAYPSHDWTLQLIMEMQKTLGNVERAVDELTDQIKMQGEKIDKISHKVSFAQGAVWVIAGILGLLLLLTKIWDIHAILSKPHP